MASLSFSTTSRGQSFREDGTGVFGGFSLKDVIYTYVIVGFTAEKQHDQPMSTVMTRFANFLAYNPMNLTAVEVANALGADSVRRIEDLSFAGFFPEEFAREVTAASAAALPILPHEQGTDIMGTVFGVMTAFAIVTIALRIWSREVLVTRLMIDDWFMIVGFLLTTAYGIVAIIHANLLAPAIALWDMSWNTYAQTQLYQTTLSLIYPAPLFFIKTSLLLFYLRLCPSYPSEARSVFRTSIFVTFFFILATAVTNFFVLLLQCDRIAYWEEELTTPCKLDSKMAQIAIGGVGVVTDLLLWLMPLPLVWRLNLGKREKFLAIITFGLGAMACVVSAFRLRAIQLYGYLRDGESLSVSVSVLTVIELNLAIICSSAPAIRALIIHYAPRILNVYSPSRVRSQPSSTDVKEINPTENAEGTYIIQVGLNVHGNPRMQPQYPANQGDGAGIHGGGGHAPPMQMVGRGMGASIGARRLV
ncbi:hypothetical protein DRE_04666 [Drechslerella stenobrocha 248]|uniref:Rhodopsin domain-containing protein n=1 Tax=Drechslerella stenobrocha 248 TaxID=1043628 RepID=W7I0S2_9PEZI|nr:hypothetical protein DRE_04666 [Drechslerella stenobrocha 248]